MLLGVAACKGESRRVESTEQAPVPSDAAAVVAPDAVLVAKPVTPRVLQGCELVSHARTLATIAACAPGELTSFSAAERADVAKRCEKLAPINDNYRDKWLSRAKPYLGKIVPAMPANIPDKVIYPFGGADLVTALTTFPEAAEITTISLEPIGDPRRVDKVRGKSLGRALDLGQKALSKFMRMHWSVTDNLDDAAWSALPGQLVLMLWALELHQLEAVSLRFFRLNRDGSLRYVECSELPAVGHKRRRMKKEWRHNKTIFADAFNHMELRYRQRGDKGAPVRIYRHIAANLANKHLARDARVLKHLKAKGKVTAMTKAAGYMLWMPIMDDFRDYLLAHVVWMVSDTTGIPPRWGKPAGFEYETHGVWTAMYHMYKDKWPKLQKQMRDMWASQPLRKIRFRYGYWDVKVRPSLMIMRRRS